VESEQLAFVIGQVLAGARGNARLTASPIAKASGTKRTVLARHVRNRRLADELYLQAFAALTGSRGARIYYDRQRARGATHHQALRALSNRLVGVLRGCLRYHQPYNEITAWATQTPEQAAA
jgi:hypothetical protein